MFENYQHSLELQLLLQLSQAMICEERLAQLQAKLAGSLFGAPVEACSGIRSGPWTGAEAGTRAQLEPQSGVPAESRSSASVEYPDRAGVDWTQLLDLAKRHGTYPLLHKHLSKMAAGVVPASVINELQGMVRVKAKHNFLLAAELIKVMHLFRARGIEFYAFKGPTLALLAYGDPAARVFLDLDIFVPEDKVPEAQMALLEAGYTPEPALDPPLPIELIQSRLFRRLEHEQSFARRESGRAEPSFVIDIHWQFVEPSVMKLEPETVEQHERIATILGQPVKTISMELLFLVLCAHGTKHQWQKLSWLVDINELMVRHPDINFEQIYSMAGNFGLKAKLDLTIMLCRKAFPEAPLKLPEWLNDRVDRAAFRFRELLDLTVRCWGDPSEVRNLRTYWLYQCSTFDRPWHAIAFFVQAFCSPNTPTYRVFPLPNWAFSAYYLIQPFILVWEFMRARLSPAGEAEAGSAQEVEVQQKGVLC